MRHARDDYNRIQDPAGLIGEDEPVFLIRAQDACAAQAIDEYACVALRAGAPAIASRAIEWANEVREWQRANGCKVPDMPGGDS